MDLPGWVSVRCSTSPTAASAHLSRPDKSADWPRPTRQNRHWASARDSPTSNTATSSAPRRSPRMHWLRRNWCVPVRWCRRTCSAVQPVPLSTKSFHCRNPCPGWSWSRLGSFCGCLASTAAPRLLHLKQKQCRNPRTNQAINQSIKQLIDEHSIKSRNRFYCDVPEVLWWLVVRSSGNTGWLTMSFTRNRCPDTRPTWPRLTTVENSAASEKFTLHKFSEPFWWQEIMETTGGSTGVSWYSAVRSSDSFNME